MSDSGENPPSGKRRQHFVPRHPTGLAPVLATPRPGSSRPFLFFSILDRLLLVDHSSVAGMALTRLLRPRARILYPVVTKARSCTF